MQALSHDISVIVGDSIVCLRGLAEEEAFEGRLDRGDVVGMSSGGSPRCNDPPLMPPSKARGPKRTLRVMKSSSSALSSLSRIAIITILNSSQSPKFMESSCKKKYTDNNEKN